MANHPDSRGQPRRLTKMSKEEAEAHSRNCMLTRSARGGGVRFSQIRSATSRLRGTLHLSAESLAQMLQASLVRGRWQGAISMLVIGLLAPSGGSWLCVASRHACGLLARLIPAAGRSARGPRSGKRREKFALSKVPSMLQAILLAVALATVAAKSGKGGLTTLKSPLDESAWEGVRAADAMPGFNVEVLHSTSCSKKVRRGDEVQIFFGAATGQQHVEQAASRGLAEQNFIVGKHNVPAVNKAIVGM
eukprot:s1618_g7.t1